MAVWLAFTWPMFLGRVYFPTDFARQAYAKGPQPAKVTSMFVDIDDYLLAYPWHAYLGTELRAGHLPLWDPTRFAGAPYAANLATGAFYPPNWLYALGSVPVVATLIWAASLLASLLLTSGLLGLLGLHPFAAALGAIVWSLSGFMLSWAMFDLYFGAALWLPLALAGIELSRRGRWRLGIPAAGVGLALSVAAGHAQISLYVWLATALWAGVGTLVTAARARRAGAPAVMRELARGVTTTGAAFAAGAGLAAVPILGGLQYAHEIVRQTETVASASLTRLTSGSLPTFLIPDYRGSLLTGNYATPATPGLFVETTVFSGIITLPLAVAGLFHRDRRLPLAFGLLAAVGVGAAFGTPLAHLLQAMVPGIGRTRAIARYKLFISFGLAGLAAAGLDAILRRSRAAISAAAGASAGVVAALVVMTATRWGTRLPASYITPRGLREIAVAGIALLTLVVAARVRIVRTAAPLVLIGLLGVDLCVWGFPYHRFQHRGAAYPASPETGFLASVPGLRPRYGVEDVFSLPPPLTSTLPFNAALVEGLYSINGYDAFIPSRFIRLLQLVDPAAEAVANTNFVLPLPPRSQELPILDLLGVRSIVAAGLQPAPGTPLFTGPPRPFVGPTVIYDQAGAFPPAFVASCWTAMRDTPALAALATMSRAQLGSTALIAPGPGAASLGTPSATCSPAPAPAVRHYQAQDVVVTTAADSPGGVLVLTDDWLPGWTATVDGHPAPVLRADFALRAVNVGQGAHTVRFRYTPSWPLQGLAASVLTVVALLLALRPDRPRRSWPATRATMGQPVVIGHADGRVKMA